MHVKTASRTRAPHNTKATSELIGRARCDAGDPFGCAIAWSLNGDASANAVCHLRGNCTARTTLSPRSTSLAQVTCIAFTLYVGGMIRTNRVQRLQASRVASLSLALTLQRVRFSGRYHLSGQRRCRHIVGTRALPPGASLVSGNDCSLSGVTPGSDAGCLHPTTPQGPCW